MITIEKMIQADWPVIKAIYEEGIQSGNATFEQSSPEWDIWDNSHMKIGRIVAKADGNVIGWAALTSVSGRCVYAGVAEVSVYVSAGARGKGVGKILLQKLVADSELNNLWTLQAGIFPENIASIKIHEACGFRIIGKRERIGKMGNVWRDTLLLEKRSSVVGI